MTSPRPIEALQQALQQREREIALLKETALAVGSELDLDRVFHLVAERARELIDAETVLVPILNPDCDEYTYRAGSGAHADEIVGESLPLDFGVCGWVWKNRRPWWRGVLDELSPQERNQWEKEVGTLIMVPLVGREHFLGGIAGMNKRGGDFTENDLNLLILFAGQVAIAIENAMAMAQVREAQQAAEAYQAQLQQLNKRLLSVNRELEYRSLYDQLTGLPNRSLLRDRLQERMAMATDAYPMAVLLIDLDRFQDVNDTLGHEEGDQLIRAVAERFKAVAGPMETLGRIGGDEFLLVMVNTGAERAIEVARALQESLKRPIHLSGHNVAVTASIGVAIYPRHGNSPTTLLKHADAAMYVAKRNKNDVRLYDRSYAQVSSGRLTLVSDLQQGLERQEFCLYYQPKIAIADGSIVGFEALARWPHKVRGFVPPDMFISAMEQTGLIYDFSCFAIETAAEQCAAWQQRGWAVQVAVNVPVTVILEPRFLDYLKAVSTRHPLCEGLAFEITESLFLSDYDRLSAILGEMRDLGVSFSIDDFGTGHSSLSRLRRLPVSELKIDRSFVMDMEKNRDDLAIVESTIRLAHNLGLKVVAEGVETAQVLQHLTRLECDLAQGYHLGRPMPATDVDAFVQQSGFGIAMPSAGVAQGGDRSA
ncbi:MAG: bifunctional diguanylate cyclase/phosphodiesterase [Ectothiorhodospiraceae bacterium]|jgi:diguanylate cyclase (GGDEF)-like protein|nr:bifunctional diguanylate cyclase/phosphodiesterase [Ectothiorhodospiraceae bacterium]